MNATKPDDAVFIIEGGFENLAAVVFGPTALMDELAALENVKPTIISVEKAPHDLRRRIVSAAHSVGAQLKVEEIGKCPERPGAILIFWFYAPFYCELLTRYPEVPIKFFPKEAA